MLSAARGATLHMRVQNLRNELCKTVFLLTSNLQVASTATRTAAPFLRRGPVFGFLPLRSPVVLKREFSSKLHTLQPYLPYMVNGGAYIRQPASARSRARDKYRTKHVTCIRRHVPFDLCMPPRASAQCAQRARISGSTVLRLERCIMDSGCLSTCERRARVCRRWK